MREGGIILAKDLQAGQEFPPPVETSRNPSEEFAIDFQHLFALGDGGRSGARLATHARTCTLLLRPHLSTPLCPS